jgi:hypothetical protein
VVEALEVAPPPQAVNKPISKPVPIDLKKFKIKTFPFGFVNVSTIEPKNGEIK